MIRITEELFSSPAHTPVMLFSGLCQKRYGTNFPAEGGVRGERWEHIINLATRCILAPHADPCQQTGAGFSLLPPCAAWQPHTCSPAASLIPGWPRCFHWKSWGGAQPKYWGRWGGYFEVQVTKKLYWRRPPSCLLCRIFRPFGKAEEAQPRAFTSCKLWLFMLLWVSPILQACLLDSLCYQEFKRIMKEIREEKTSDARPKYFCYSSDCYVWPAKLNTKIGSGRSEVLFCTSGFWFRRNNGNPLSQIHNSKAIQ